MGHLLLSQGDDDSQHVHMPADYGHCTFLADSMDRRRESDTAAHVDRADPVTKQEQESTNLTLEPQPQPNPNLNPNLNPLVDQPFLGCSFCVSV